MSYQDKTLICQDCGKSFTFTVEEQEFHAQKGYTNPPKRCPDCRSARREGREGSGADYGRSSKPMYPATCAQCGKQTEVPFQPRGDRPVYCRECYGKLSSHSSSSY